MKGKKKRKRERKKIMEAFPFSAAAVGLNVASHQLSVPRLKRSRSSVTRCDATSAFSLLAPGVGWLLRACGVVSHFGTRGQIRHWSVAPPSLSLSAAK